MRRITGLWPPRIGALAAAVALTATVSVTFVAQSLPRNDEPVAAAVNPFAHEPFVHASPATITLRIPATTRGSAVLHAAATPPSPGGLVQFQVRAGGTWHTVASATQDALGRASVSWRPPRSGMYTFRSALPAFDSASPPANLAVLARGVRIVRWREWIEPGIENAASFVPMLKQIFIDARGWASTGRVLFRYAPAGPVDMVARLATPRTTDRLCRPADTRQKWSCHASGGIVLNSERWFRGSPSLDMPIAEYRALLVNHETGHALGFGHSGCGSRGSLAPVMMQQSKGLDGCRANPWPLPRELARL